MPELHEAEQKLGYTFRDRQLLEACFTHSSYAAQHGCQSNERLEFLGDALLGFLVAEELYRGGEAPEGEMTRARIRMVSAPPLAAAIRADGLERFLRAADIRNVGEKAISSLFEALVAGIYLDGGIAPARAFVQARLSLAGEDVNHKGKLQEWLQARHLPRAEYISLAQTGEPHAPRFTVRAQACGESAEGEGGSLRAAQQAAAKELLFRLEERTGG